MSFLFTPFEKVKNLMTFPTKEKYVYDLSEGGMDDAGFLSRKGANLCEAAKLGYSVPPALIISTQASLKYRDRDFGIIDSNLLQEIQDKITTIEQSTGTIFGSTQEYFPLLLTLRGGPLANTETIVGNEELDLDLDTVNNEVMDVLGAPDSWCVPGLKESCLGIGFNDAVSKHLASLTSVTFAYNAYAHYLIRFGTIVMDIPKQRYRAILSGYVNVTGRSGDDLREEDVLYLVNEFKKITKLPEDPMVQLQMAIKAMYDAWFATEAVLYRREVLGEGGNANEGLQGGGIALIIQTLVMGSTGIAFSRNPINGEKGSDIAADPSNRGAKEEGSIFGCMWLKTGNKISLQQYGKQKKGDEGGSAVSGAQESSSAGSPEVIELTNRGSMYQKILDIARGLELIFMDMIQFEFVIVDDLMIHILQIYPGRRTPYASIRVAIDMQRENLITEREALMRINFTQVSQAFVQCDLETLYNRNDRIASGLCASRGILVGQVAFTSLDVMELKKVGVKGTACMEGGGSSGVGSVILCLPSVDEFDERVLPYIDGLLLMHGGVLSSPAILCRALGKPCLTMISGFHLANVGPAMTDNTNAVEDAGRSSSTAMMMDKGPVYIEVNEYLKIFKGQILTLDASHGNVYRGGAEMYPIYHDPYFQTLSSWSDVYRQPIHVNARIDNKVLISDEMELAMKLPYQADGCGMIATEVLVKGHQDRLKLMRLILITASSEEKGKHLEAMQCILEDDFIAIFRMQMKLMLDEDDQATTAGSSRNPAELVIGEKMGTIGIKLLDESLGRLLVDDEEEGEMNPTEMAQEYNMSISEVKAAIRGIEDINAEHSGIRGVRMAALHPLIAEMQVRAIFHALWKVQQEVKEKQLMKTSAVKQKKGNDDKTLNVHFWVPGVTAYNELAAMIRLINRIYDEVKITMTTQSAGGEQSMDVPLNDPAAIDKPFYTIGVVLDTPRACLRADSLAMYTKFFAIDLNKLTAHVYAIGKTDANKLFPRYVLDHIYMADPFQSLDDKGVGSLLQNGLMKARKAILAKRQADRSKVAGTWLPSAVANVITTGATEDTLDIYDRELLDVSVIEGDQISDVRSIEYLLNILRVHSLAVPYDKIPIVKILVAQARIRRMRELEEADQAMTLDGETVLF